MADICMLCGRPLPTDTRWAPLRWLNPRPPMCMTDPEDCYRMFAARLGLNPSDEEVRRVVRQRG